MSLLTVAETAEILRVNPLTVRRYIADGRLPAVRAGRGVRVRSEALDSFLTPVTEAPQPSQLSARAGTRGAQSRIGGAVLPPRGRALSFDDPLWELVGSASDAPPSDAAKKHEYLAGGNQYAGPAGDAGESDAAHHA